MAFSFHGLKKDPEGLPRGPRCRGLQSGEFILAKDSCLYLQGHVISEIPEHPEYHQQVLSPPAQVQHWFTSKAG